MIIRDKILVVDDDHRMRDLLRTSLEAEMFEVIEAAGSAELFQKLEKSRVDLITLDVMLDSENGLDLVRDIRKISQIPVILVTGRVDLIDTVVGLELGADDYITKPFLVRELIARVRSVLRRSRTSNREKTDGPEMPTTSRLNTSAGYALELIRFGDWSINTAARELRNHKNQIVSLTTTEYDLLDILVSRPQRVLSREYLMERLTGRELHPSDRVIDNHVAQLRKKLWEQSSEVEWIKTVRGSGYMFTGRTTRETLPE